MHTLRACAIRYPRFTEDFCPRLNSVLLDRHRQGIQDGRTKTLNEATIQLGRDLALSALASTTPTPDEIDPWLTDESGQFSLEPGGPWLSQLRPNHFRSYLLEEDRYGVLIARDRAFSQQTHLQTCSTPRNAPSMRQSRSPSSQPANTPWTTFPISGESTSLIEGPRALDLDLHEPPIGTSQALDSVLDFQFDPFMGASPDSSRTPGEKLSRLSEPTSLHHGWHRYAHYLSPLQISDFNDSEMASRDDHPLHANVTTPDTSQTGSTVSRGSQSDTQSDPGMESEPNSDFHSSRDIDMDDPARETPAPIVPAPANIQRVEAWAEALTHRRPTVGKLNLRRGPAKRRRGQQSECLDSTIVSPSLFAHARPTMEGVLQTRYHDLLKDFATKLVNEARHGGASQQQKCRAQWFNPDTKWASVWTHSNGELPRGSALSAGEAEVHYYASDEFIVAARKGQVFRKPIVIKEKFMDSGMHTIDGVASLLQDEPSDAVIDVRKLDDFQPASIPVDDFVTGIRTNRLEGANALNLRNLTKCHQPLFTMLFRFRLLQSLVGRAGGRTLGKRITSTPVDVASCTSFSILGLAGAFSGPHLDSLCGTWMRNLAGAKFWMIIPQEDMESQWDTFAMSGWNWVPNGKQRLLLLEQDDVLLLPPGLRVVHAVHSPVNCLMEGGMLWDELNIVQTLESIRWICKNQATTNEAIAYQLPDIIRELEKLVKEQPNRFRGSVPKVTFLRKFDEAVSSLRDLGCDCPQQDCDERCECRQEGRRCTAWCTQHPQIASLDCMNE
ncbi:hypothetical protein BDV96DRAFT_586839 [Lophiotrema nucula]|uniref:JmjC domain-containing protein n=1 Tax=Lophiotrema nucula TaxID=690887 RepID=A0A6A5YRT8_9PLEO|nr:hypothetical protein BDV96DRAFT_586839 [Lophiotrema nucula]